MATLDNLKKLYQNMIITGKIATSFNVTTNGREFTILFVADSEEKTVYLSTTGADWFTIIISIPDSFVMEQLYIENDKYLKLVKYLGLKYDPLNHFKPLHFFVSLDSQFPVEAIREPKIEDRARIINNAYDQNDGIYFKGWIDWKNKKTSKANHQKTIAIIGKNAADKLYESNISSSWTNDPQQQDLSKLLKWTKLVDED